MKRRVEIFILTAVAAVGLGALALECVAAYPLIRFHWFARTYISALSALVESARTP